MITIPTSELVTVLSGALAFAPVVKTDSQRGVLIEWDGDETLTASGYDVLSGASISWWDGAGREGIADEIESDKQIVVHYGGDDPRWRAFVAYDDVTDLLKTFKLPAKLWWVPVNLKISPMGNRLLVERSAEFGKPEATMVVRVDRDVTAKFPDVRGITEYGLASPGGLHETIQFAPHRLGAYDSVTVADVMTLRFGLPGSPTIVRMGSRVVGFAHPVGTQKSEARAQQEVGLPGRPAGVPDDEVFGGDRRYVDATGEPDPEA